MDLNLNGKTAAEAGATRGIGRAMAELLAAEGCNVSLCARDGAAVDHVVESLKAGGANAMGQAADATDRAAQDSWLDATVDAFGGLDIFIANVSALNQGTDEDAWRQSFEVDMMASFNGIDAALPHLKGANGGSIVLISSIAALHVPGAQNPMAR